MEKYMRSRKGISLAEVVIALVVITVISLSTLSVVFVSAKVEAKTVVAMEVRNSAENAVECFRFADGNMGTFTTTLNLSVGIDKNAAEDTTKEEWQVEGDTYSYNAGRFTVTIKLKRNDQGEPTGFDYLAVDSAGNEIYEFTFTNGGEP